MKTLIIILLLSSFSTFAGQCPNLKAAYHCVLSNGQYSLLTIDQKTLSGPQEEELVEYSFDYSAIPGGADVIKAGVTPQADDFGWLTKCQNDRLRSIPVDGSMLSEIYLDKDLAIVRTLNGSLAMSCPRKISL